MTLLELLKKIETTGDGSRYRYPYNTAVCPCCKQTLRDFDQGIKSHLHEPTCELWAAIRDQEVLEKEPKTVSDKLRLITLLQSDLKAMETRIRRLIGEDYQFMNYFGGILDDEYDRIFNEHVSNKTEPG